MNDRHKIFFATAMAMMLLTVIRLVTLAGNHGQIYRAEALRLARFSGELPAIRGRIYDSGGQLIAWSERCYDLRYDPQRAIAGRFQKIRQLVKQTFPTAAPLNSPGVETMLKTNLTAAELEIADKLSEQYPELDITLRWERRYTNYHSSIGEVRQIDGVEVGVSGLEKKYDDHLRGVPGKFEVMLDRHGCWINSTFRITVPSQKGEDLELTEFEDSNHDESTQ